MRGDQMDEGTADKGQGTGNSVPSHTSEQAIVFKSNRKLGHVRQARTAAQRRVKGVSVLLYILQTCTEAGPAQQTTIPAK